MKSKFFLLFFLFSNAYVTASVYESFKDQKWKFIEHMFINKPAQECNTISKKVKQWGVTLLTIDLLKLFFRSTYGLSINNKNWFKFSELEPPDKPDLKAILEYKKKEQQFNAGVVGILSVSIVSGVIAYRLYNRLYRNSIEYHACLEFIENWPEYKEYTPKELQNSFEELYQKHIHHELMNKDIYEMIVVIKELVSAKLAQ